ncbi:hypothetical protein ACFXHD_00440 [Streptomyces hydrogenans]
MAKAAIFVMGGYFRGSLGGPGSGFMLDRNDLLCAIDHAPSAAR